MSWICIKHVLDEDLEVVFKVGTVYDEVDDRGESKDISIVLVCEKKIRRYLIDRMVRGHFKEIKLEYEVFNEIVKLLGEPGMTIELAREEIFKKIKEFEG